ncbi:ribonuclease HI family protein [candidate division WWE3 bacterium]|nr:ribonuclease HI family protein [candidate division WWE3 bacterium]
MHTDGGSRGNPGPAGAGVHIEANGKEYLFGYFLGERTNNQAEYLALICGIQTILKLFNTDDIDELQVIMDSEVVVKQLNGEYQVKEPILKQYNGQVLRLVKKFPMVKFTHTLREKNKHADFAVNQVLDIQHGIGQSSKTN